MKLFFVVIFISVLLGYNCYSQTIMTNAKGEKIISYPDGSWKYLDSNNPDDKKLNTSLTHTKASNESDLYSQINELYKATKEKEQILIKTKEEIRLEKVLLEYNMRIQKNDFSVAEIKVLKSKISSVNLKSKEIDKQINSTQKESDTFLKMLKMESEKRAKAFIKYLNSLPNQRAYSLNNKPKIIGNEIINDSPPTEEDTFPIPSETKLKPIAENLKSSSSKIRTSEYYSKYNEASDVFIHPIPKKCNIEFEGIDEFSGKKRKDIVSEPLFFMTPEPMKKNLGGKQYINCSAALSFVTGGSAFLTLNIVIASLDASRLFGGLEKGSVINLKFLDGDNIAIINNRNDFGIFDTNAKTTTYRAQCNLGAAIQKILATKELDKIRITWNTGYEDYEVYDIDLLIRQMNCL